MANHIGKQYNRLQIIEQKGSRSVALCVCGQAIETTTYNITSGRAASCGCLRREVTGNLSYRHGEVYTPTWYSWAAMKSRCHSATRHNAASYLEKGITYPPEWEDYVAFKADMGERPPGTTLDRCDNEKSYSKENCRWATAHEQVTNRGQSGYRWGTGAQVKMAMQLELELLGL